MSENIRVSEVSDILRKQLEGINANVQLDEIGTVLQVSDGVVRIYGLRNAEANELLEFDNGIKAIVMNLEEDNVGAVLLGPTDKIKEGFVVKRTKRIASIRVGEGMLGRVIDPLGEPLDGKGLIGGELYDMPLERKAPGVIYRQPVNQPLQTGLKAVDAMIPIGRGQRELIIGDRQTGKTAIAIDTIINQRTNFLAGDPVYCIYVAIGQKGSTVASIVNTLREYGALDYTVVVAATAGDPAALQYYAPFAGAAIGGRVKAVDDLPAVGQDLPGGFHHSLPAAGAGLCQRGAVCLKAGGIVHHGSGHGPLDRKGAGSHRLRFERLHVGAFVNLGRHHAAEIFLQIQLHRPRAKQGRILGAGQFYRDPHSLPSVSLSSSVRLWSCASTSLSFSGMGRPIWPAFSKRLTPSLEM